MFLIVSDVSLHQNTGSRNIMKHSWQTHQAPWFSPGSGKLQEHATTCTRVGSLGCDDYDAGAGAGETLNMMVHHHFPCLSSCLGAPHVEAHEKRVILMIKPVGVKDLNSDLVINKNWNT